MVCVLPSHSFPFFLCIALHNDFHIGYSCQANSIASASIDLSHLPWSVYIYGPNGFASEHVVGRNIDVIGYSFPKGI